eukprot:COSAG02_NODE_14444_length_1271_cov_1.752560_1_plen_194_part_10
MGDSRRTMADLHEREFVARQEARRRRDLRPRADSMLGLDLHLRPEQKRNGLHGGATPPAPLGAGWMLALAGLVGLAIWGSSGARAHGGIFSFFRSRPNLAMAHVNHLDDIKAAQMLDSLLSRDMSSLLRDTDDRPSSVRRTSTCSARACPIGSRVELSSEYQLHGDAALGPLVPGGGNYAFFAAKWAHDAPTYK